VNEQIRQALARDRTIDIATIGCATGQSRRIEIWFHNPDGTVYITGTPGQCDWYANIVAHPDFTFHLEWDVTAGFPARATPITNPAERRPIFQRILGNIGNLANLETGLTSSPLIRVEFSDTSAPTRGDRRFPRGSSADSNATRQSGVTGCPREAGS
jgi:hypothetical protein